MRTSSLGLPMGLLLSAAAALTMAAAGCRNDAELDSSNRGSGSQTSMTSVENAFIVPLYIPGHCAIQAGDLAKLQFTATNNRDTENERLLFIATDAADEVHMSPDTRLDIPPNSAIAAGQQQTQNGQDPASVDVTLQGLRDAARPGTSVNVTFGFEKAGSIEMRVPVEACPNKSQPGP